MSFQNFLHAVYGLPGGFRRGNNARDGWRYVRKRTRKLYTEERKKQVRKAYSIVKDFEIEKQNRAGNLSKQEITSAQVGQQISQITEQKIAIENALSALSKEIEGYLFFENIKDKLRIAQEQLVLARRRIEEEEEFLLLLMNLE